MKTLSLTPVALICNLLGLLTIAGCSAEAPSDPSAGGELAEVSEALESSGGGYIDAKGAFTCDFRMAGNYPPERVAPDIERDRMLMSANDGILQKHIPMKLDFEHFTEGMPDLLSGGRYLIDTWDNARDYKEFVTSEYELGGVQFFERPEFFDPECHAFKVVKAYDFGSIETDQIVVRTERFAMPDRRDSVDRLRNKWSTIHAEAAARGLTSVWLLYNDRENIASLVYMANRVVPYDPNVPDFASLGALESAPPLGDSITSMGWARTFDRTQWVFTIWRPFVPGDQGEPSIWPHSPPFAAPSCGDTVCENSRGENDTSCPSDCTAGCGDAVCSPGESYVACPGDCDQTNSSHDVDDHCWD